MRSIAAPPPRPRDEIELPQTAPDFSRREPDLREFMDEPCTFLDWQKTVQHLATANRLLRGDQPVLNFLARVVQARGVGYEPLHIVDVGCGEGETLRKIARWAAKRSLAVKLTGIDMNPYGARAAKERDREEQLPPKTMEWITADAMAVKLDAPVDVVISSLFTHHLPDDDIVTFLCWQDQKARWGWIVSDLRRSQRAHVWFGRLAKVMRWHPFIVHDGLASIRRAFVDEDWRVLLAKAEIEGAVVVERGSARLCVEKIKPLSAKG